MSFSRAHFSMLLQYIGISFITGAISHGFFSGTRSLLTGAFGVICFTIGTLLAGKQEDTLRNIALGSLLAVGIGAVTGGLQHFPDSPERSLIIIPVGYIISVFLYASIHSYHLRRREYTYILLSSIVTLLVTVGIFLTIENTGITRHTHDVTSLDTPLVTLVGSGNTGASLPIDPESIPGHEH